MKKGWLPPSYGKQTYTEMNEEDKHVIDTFKGEKSYMDTLAEKDRYIVAPESKIFLIA